MCPPASAKVQGRCSNCHTVTQRTDGAAKKSVMTEAGVFEVSTVGDCLSCHGSSGSETVGMIGECRVPIVYNMQPPSKPLAAGNFYWVSQGPAWDAYGHNVRGVCQADCRLSNAPGGTWDPGQGGCACHSSLAGDDPSNFKGLKNGCRGCHLVVRHHAQDAGAGSVTVGENGHYRFLSGHTGSMGTADLGCEGVEEPSWEQNADSAHHNRYKGSLREDDPTTVDHLCKGCHAQFHAGGGSPWLRHPTGVIMPTKGEYARYDCSDAYNPVVPVGFTDPASPSRGTAVVLCLSCHRAHGSPYPSLLRWDINNMKPGQGCRACHTQKR
jgi:predicted CXXCH cytochrome family protein